MAVAYLHRGGLKVSLGKDKPACKDFEVANVLGNADAKKMLELHCVAEEDAEESDDKKSEEKTQKKGKE